MCWPIVPPQVMLPVHTKDKHIFCECALKIALTKSTVILKCTKYRSFGGRAAPGPTGELTTLLRPVDWI